MCRRVSCTRLFQLKITIFSGFPMHIGQPGNLSNLRKLLKKLKDVPSHERQIESPRRIVDIPTSMISLWREVTPQEI